MFMVLSSWQSHCESSPGSFDECRMVPSGRRPKTKPDDLGWVRLYRLPETTPTIAIYYYSAQKLMLRVSSKRDDAEPTQTKMFLHLLESGPLRAMMSLSFDKPPIGTLSEPVANCNSCFFCSSVNSCTISQKYLQTTQITDSLMPEVPANNTDHRCQKYLQTTQITDSLTARAVITQCSWEQVELLATCIINQLAAYSLFYATIAGISTLCFKKVHPFAFRNN